MTKKYQDFPNNMQITQRVEQEKEVENSHWFAKDNIQIGQKDKKCINGKEESNCKFSQHPNLYGRNFHWIFPFFGLKNNILQIIENSPKNIWNYYKHFVSL